MAESFARSLSHPSQLRDDSVPLWGCWERVFEANDQPPPSTLLKVRLVSPSGKERAVSGFWDGGRLWRVRFMPDQEGTWQVETASVPADTSLHARSGSFECVSITTHNRFLRHGPVRVSANGHHLEHADGTPFFLLADTVWNGPLLSKTADWEMFLADRVAKGFTGIQFVTQAPWIAAFTNLEGEVATAGLAPLPVNPHFFRRIDARIDAINRKGLLAIPVLAWAASWNETATRYNVGRFLDEAHLISFVRYQVARYQAHHLVWILPGDGVYLGDEADKWRRVGRAVFDETAHAPVSLHPAGRSWPYEAFRDQPWLNIHGYQSSHSDSDETLTWIQTGPPARAWRTGPARPVINLEPCYEDHVSGHTGKRFSAEDVRRACYWSLLNAPTAGLTYGAHGIWGWQEKPEVPLHHPKSGIAQPWFLAKDLPGSFDMKRLAECFTSIEWWRLRPDPELTAATARTAPRDIVLAARSDAGDLAVVYQPSGGELSVALERLAAGPETEWFNPRNGQRSPAPQISPGRFVAPDDQDWVLLIRRGAGQVRELQRR
jgi:hypothetical protein